VPTIIIFMRRALTTAGNINPVTCASPIATLASD
jgi:hypothetical protein